ncbi:MAG: hypothetical protein JWL77_4061 [Chthonomonadaceae bacterium]|nr:hypothetical protein [Chthonomonadaceae bacterium]
MSDDLNSLPGVSSTTNTGTNGFQAERTPSDGNPSFASSVMMRYQDAYVVARVTTGFGSVIKGIGILLAIVIFGGAIAVANQPAVSYGYVSYSTPKTMHIIVGFVLAVIIGAMFYLLGILVSAQGQILKASLDGAVNSSPFMSNDQKAQVMSLR